MNDDQYPLICNKLKVEVKGQWGRAMKRDAVHLAPLVCQGCSSLTLARDERNYQDILVCQSPAGCPRIVRECEPEALFVDVRPFRGFLPEESPCQSCGHNQQAQASDGMPLHYCNRMSAVGLDTPCLIRGTESPDAFAEKKQARESAQLEHELELINLLDETDYGSF